MENREPSPDGPVLVLAPFGRDAGVVCSALRDVGIHALQQSSLSELVANLNDAAAAVIAEEALVHEHRGTLAHWIANQPPWSDFPFVLLTLRTGQNGAALTKLIELLGHVTVLERPLAATSLKSAVLAAIRSRRRQRQAEHYLLQLKQLADTLERRVEERTQQLLEANKRLRDEIVERERTEVALRQAQKMEAIGQLTGGIAHDFNNLLMAIIGNLELIARRVEDERIQRYVRNAMHGAQRGAKLVGQLLAFSRKQHLTPEPVDVNELVGTVAEMLSRTLGASIRVDVVTQKDLWPALVDSTQLELMLLNLAINARDAMPQGGLLTIETSILHGVPEDLRTDLKAGEYVCIAVKDTGTGMPPDVLARAFDPFFTTKEPGKGTGLGLSQVYGFARQSGGTAKIESEVGRGTVVRILLPKSTEAVVGSDDRQPDTPGAGAREHILVVDDDASVLETTRSMLDDLGYQAIAADTLDMALTAMSDQPIDLAIVDLAMPGLSGLDVGRELQRRKPGLPVVYCSGYPDLIEETSKRLDGGTLLSKPFSSRDLSIKLEATLRSKVNHYPA
ncbi:ATP-binding protein [Bradyrhizobium sp. I71]|jgi:signal transduction histidine kinase|uniref:ATP-binding protein n=1 Tax=Bradyrhizobium sp. I71 TaxID=2590772 RepID=UPI001EF9AE7B|nr:ATP-binding protein [Bradyrhizobium sp. I71]ULK94947.1 response regulator [Bradyrhizobium sp. I71]